MGHWVPPDPKEECTTLIGQTYPPCPSVELGLNELHPTLRLKVEGGVKEKGKRGRSNFQRKNNSVLYCSKRRSNGYQTFNKHKCPCHVSSTISDIFIPVELNPFFSFQCWSPHQLAAQVGLITQPLWVNLLIVKWRRVGGENNHQSYVPPLPSFHDTC